MQCNGEEFHHGLLSRRFHKSSLEAIETPHPDQLSLLTEAQVDPTLVQRTYFTFSTRFWKEGDLVQPTDGSLLEQRLSIISIDLNQGTVMLQPCDPNLPVCTIPVVSVRHVFRQGDTVRVLVGIHHGSIGTVLTPSEDQATLLLEDKDVVRSSYSSCAVQMMMLSRLWFL